MSFARIEPDSTNDAVKNESGSHMITLVMNTYISLLNFTAQGLQNVHESRHRAEAFRTAAKKAGVKVMHTFWTLGDYDGMIVYQAQSDAVATGLMLSLSGLGNVHTKSLRAFEADEFAEIIKQAPKL